MKQYSKIRLTAYAISGWLGAFPSLYYAAIYTCIIPVYALVYSQMTGRFFYANSGYEPRTKMPLVELANELKEGVIAEHEQFYRTEFFTAGEYYFNVKKLYIKFLSQSPNNIDNLYFQLDLKGSSADTRDEQTIEVRAFILVNLHFSFEGKDDGEHKIIGYLLVDPVQSSQVPEDFYKLLLCGSINTHKRYFGSKLVWPLTPKARQCLTTFEDECTGVRSASPEHFDTMLYFSVTTITTLGYGDIVPLGRLARLLVATEAFAGILIIGLFLNAIAHERDKRLSLLIDKQSR